jgi:hypothetical protein
MYDNFYHHGVHGKHVVMVFETLGRFVCFFFCIGLFSSSSNCISIS